MKIITLNIQHGGGRRIAAILEFLKQSNADLMVLTEYRLDDKSLGKQLIELGYKHQLAGSTLPKENSVLIVSKEPFDVLGVSQRIVSVRLNHFALFGVYFPQREEKYPVFTTLKSEVKEAGSSVIIVGDFNTGLHYIDEAGKTFFGAERFESLKDVGLIDSWRTRNPATKEFSWFSSQGNGFRIDHAFCSESLDQEVLTIEYLHSPREMRFSDHSALAFELKQS
jgi:exodeoxyribonuclease-3